MNWHTASGCNTVLPEKEEKAQAFWWFMIIFNFNFLCNYFLSWIHKSAVACYINLIYPMFTNNSDLDSVPFALWKFPQTWSLGVQRHTQDTTPCLILALYNKPFVRTNTHLHFFSTSSSVFVGEATFHLLS